MRRHLSFIVFGGSWCSDTQYLLPRFYKVAEEAGIDPKKIKLIGVDHKKDSHDGLSKKYGIELVPTFILMCNGKEAGRIVETVQRRIETEMLDILAKKSKK